MATYDFCIANIDGDNVLATVVSNGNVLWNESIGVSFNGNFVEFSNFDDVGRANFIEQTGWQDVPVSATIDGNIVTVVLGNNTKLSGTYSNETRTIDNVDYAMNFVGMNIVSLKLATPVVSSVVRGYYCFYLLFDKVENGRDYECSYSIDGVNGIDNYNIISISNSEEEHNGTEESNGIDEPNGTVIGSFLTVSNERTYILIDISKLSYPSSYLNKRFRFRVKATGHITDGVQYNESEWSDEVSAVCGTSSYVSNKNSSGPGSMVWALSQRDTVSTGVTREIRFEETVAGQRFDIQGADCTAIINGSGLSERVTLITKQASFSTMQRGRFNDVNVIGSVEGNVTNCDIQSPNATALWGSADNCIIHDSKEGIHTSGGEKINQCLFHHNKFDIINRRLFDRYPVFTSCTFADQEDVDSTGMEGVTFVNCISTLPIKESATSGIVKCIGIAAEESEENKLFTSREETFTNADDNDYSLKKDSPAIGFGSNSDITWSTDLAGNKRIQGAVVDVGAYEYQPETSLNKPVFSVVKLESQRVQLVITEDDARRSGFYIERADNEQFTDSVVFNTDTASSTYVMNIPKNEKLYWRIMLYGDGNNYADSQWSDVVVSLETLETPTVSFMRNTSSTIVLYVIPLQSHVAYKVRYKTVNGFYGAETEVTRNADNEIEITGLESRVEYIIDVKAVGDGVTYADSEWREVSAQTRASLPFDSTPVIGDVGRHTVKITDIECNYAVRFVITLVPSDGSETLSYNVDANNIVDGCYVVSGLPHNTEFSAVTIQAFASQASSSAEIWYESEVIDVKKDGVSGFTTLDLMTPAKPNITSVMCPSMIRFTLNNKEEPISQVCVQYKKQGAIYYGDEQVIDIETYNNKPLAVLSGLERRTSYGVRIKYIGDGVDYKDSDWLENNYIGQTGNGYTLPMALFSLTAVGKTQLVIDNISIQTGYNIPDYVDTASVQYHVKYSTSTDGPFIREENIQFDNGSYTLSNLEPNVIYYVYMWRTGNPDWFDAPSAEYQQSCLTNGLPQLEVSAPTVSSPLPGVIRVGGLYNRNAVARVVSYGTPVMMSNPIWIDEIRIEGSGASGDVYDITDLTEGRQYLVRWKAIGDDEEYRDSEWSANVNITTRSVQTLATPRITSSTVGTDSIAISFAWDSNSSENEIYYSTIFDLETATRYTKQGGSIVLDNCEEGTTYYIWARSKSNSALYSDSEYLSTNVMTKIRLRNISLYPEGDLHIETPVTATGVSILGVPSCSFLWTGIRIDTGAIVTLKSDGTSSGVSSSSYTPTVTDYRTYSIIKLKAEGKNNYVGSIEISLGAVHAVELVAPGDLAVTPCGEKEIAVTFTEDSRADSYVLEYGTDEQMSDVVILEGVSSGDTIEGLNDYTKYYVRVKAIGNDDTILSSDWSAIVSCVTTRPLPIPELTVLSSDTRSVTFTLGEVGGAVSYKVKVVNVVTGDDVEEEYTSVGEKTISGLTHSALFTIAAVAVASSASTVYYTPEYSTGTPFETAEDTVPTIVLNGAVNQVIEKRTSGVWIDPGIASVFDSEDAEEELTINDTVIYSNFDVQTLSGTEVEAIPLTVTGEYMVVYSVTDTVGNVGRAYRSVTIAESSPPVIKLYGGRFYGVPLNGAYVEPGAIAYDNVDSPLNVVTSSIIKIESFNNDLSLCVGDEVDSIDTSAQSVYRVGYQASDEAGYLSDEVYRVVFVMTNDSPDVVLLGDSTIEIDARVGVWVDPGVTAIDCDGNVIDGEGFGQNKVFKSIRLKDGTFVDEIDTRCGDSYLVSYLAIDSDNRATMTNRVVVVNGTILRQSIIGDWECGIVQGQPYNDPGVKVSDSSLVPAGATPVVMFEPELDVNTVGVYEETYISYDIKGNQTNEIKRSVYVTSPDAPRIVVSGINPDYSQIDVLYEDPMAKVVDKDNRPIDAGVTCVIRDSEGNDLGTALSVKYLSKPYTITYFANVDELDAIPVTRVVHGTGWGLPTIHLNENEKNVVTIGDYWVDNGAYAEDSVPSLIPVRVRVINQEGNVIEEKVVSPNSDNVYSFVYSVFSTSQVGIYRFEYSAVDSRGYQTKAISRTLTVKDYDSPKVKLNNSSSLSFYEGDEYIEYGAEVIDEYDGYIPWTEGDGSRRVKVSYFDADGETIMSIDTNEIGRYRVVYSYTNQKGKTGTAERFVRVLADEEYDPSEKITRAYLEGNPRYEKEVGIEEYEEPSVPVTVTVDGVDVTDDAEIERVILFYDRDGIQSKVDEIDNDKVGYYEIRYFVTYDGEELKDDLYRVVEFKDTTAPLVELVGNSYVVYMKGTAFTYDDPGVKVVYENSSDECAIVSRGEFESINWNEPRQYIQQYYAVDSSGNRSEVLSRSLFIIDPENSPSIHLKGSSEQFAQIGYDYVDPGIVVKNPDGEVIENPIIDARFLDADRNEIDSIPTDDFGKYYVVYFVEDSFGIPARPVERRVTVGDSECPVLTLADGCSSYIKLGIGDEFVMPSVVVTDNYKKLNPVITKYIYHTMKSPDNRVSDVLTNTTGTYFIVFTAKDSSGNYAELEVKVDIADGAGPVITFESDCVTAEAGVAFVPPVPEVVDDSGEEIVATVASSTVNINLIGDYEVVYEAVDSSNNRSTKTLAVQVRDTIKPVLTLTEPVSEINVEYNDADFVDPGATAVDSFEGEVEVVSVIISVNDDGSEGERIDDFSAMVQRVGRYKVVYTASDSSGNTAVASRYISVKHDITPPVVSIVSPESGFVTVSLVNGDTYVEPTATAFDAYDNRTWTNDELEKESNVDASTAGNYEVVFSATDASGNTGIAVAPVYVTTQESPVITLIGEESVRIEEGGVYQDAGATAVYADEHGVSHSVNVTANIQVDTDVPGFYNVVYNASNGAVPAVPVTRKVEVVPRLNASAIEKNKIRVTFNKGIGGAGYTLFISEDNSVWTEASCTKEYAGTGKATRDVIVEPNKVYYFKVKHTASQFYTQVISKRTYFVENLSVDITDAGHALLSWDALEDGGNYIVDCISEDAIRTVLVSASDDLTDTSFTAEITPNVLYTFRVKSARADESEKIWNTATGGSSVVYNLTPTVRSAYIKLTWSFIDKIGTFAIRRVNGDNEEQYVSTITSWYNTKSAGENGPFEYNVDYTYYVSAIRDGLTPFESSVEVTAEKTQFTDFSGVNYYYIGGEYGSFQKREDWSLEMNGEPLDFAPQFGEGYRFCVGTDTLIDELPGAYENKSDKGVFNIRVYNDKEVTLVSSYEQVEILHLKLDGKLTIQLNINGETHYDPIGVTKGVHLGMYRDVNNTVLSKGIFELSSGSEIYCVSKDNKYICLTDNLQQTNLSIDKTAKIYANVNRQDRPFKCWMFSYGWERDKDSMAESNSSPLTITNNVYVRNLIIPVNPVITGNYRRFVIDGDIKTSPTSGFYWNAEMHGTIGDEKSGTLLIADTDGKMEQFFVVLADILASKPYSMFFNDRDEGASLAGEVDDIALDVASAYYGEVICSQLRKWGVWDDSFVTGFFTQAKEKILSARSEQMGFSINAKQEADLKSKFESYVRWVGNYFSAIASSYTTKITEMAERVEFCLVGERDQSVSLVPGVVFVYPMKIRKRGGMVTFNDIIIPSLNGMCGFNNMVADSKSGVTVNESSEITIVSDSKFSKFVLYGKLNIDEDIELKVGTSSLYAGSVIAGHCQNPNKTGGYLYIVNAKNEAVIESTMDIGTWVEPIHYYYQGGSTGSFSEPSDWMEGTQYLGTSMRALTDPPKTRDGNIFHIERGSNDSPVVISGLETSQIISPVDTNDSGKISIVTTGNVTIHSDVEYNHIENVVVNSGTLTLSEKSYIGYIEEYNGGKLVIPSGYVGGVTYAYPNVPDSDDYYLDTKEPVDYNVECFADRCEFTYDDMIGMITTHGVGTVFSVGNDIHLAVDSTTQLLGEANNLYVYGEDVSISGTQRFVGVYGSVTGGFNANEIEVYDGGTLDYIGVVSGSVSVYGEATIMGRVGTVAVYGSAIIGACLGTVVVQPDATASFVDNADDWNETRCPSHGKGETPCHMNSVYVYGTAVIDTPIGYVKGSTYSGKLEVGQTGKATINGEVIASIKNEGVIETYFNVVVGNLFNYGKITMDDGTIKVLGTSARFAGSVTQGEGTYLLKWNVSEQDTNGVITVPIQDYDIPVVKNLHHDDISAYWDSVKGATSYIVRVVTEE